MYIYIYIYICIDVRIYKYMYLYKFISLYFAAPRLTVILMINDNITNSLIYVICQIPT